MWFLNHVTYSLALSFLREESCSLSDFSHCLHYLNTERKQERFTWFPKIDRMQLKAQKGGEAGWRDCLMFQSETTSAYVSSSPLERNSSVFTARANQSWADACVYLMQWYTHTHTPFLNMAMLVARVVENNENRHILKSWITSTLHINAL